MSDYVDRMLREQEEMRRAADPFLSAYEEAKTSGAFDRLLEADSRLRDLKNDPGYLAAIDASRDAGFERRLLEEHLAEARRQGQTDLQSEYERTLLTSVNDPQLYDALYRVPRTDEISRIVRDSLNSESLALSLVQSDGWTHELEKAMASMRHPWISLDHGAGSIRGFAGLQAIGHFLNARQPFDLELGASLRRGLGDWRDPITWPGDLENPVARARFYVGRGFDPELTDFTVGAFKEGVELAGLVEFDEGLDVDDEEEQGLALAREAYAILQSFEIRLRGFIVRVLTETHGEHWMKRGLDRTMVERWINLRDKEVRAGRQERSRLIDYANVSDYEPIIKRNWKVAFERVFIRYEDVRESFQRLYPVRHPIAHMGVVTTDDMLFLLSETKRIQRAIDRHS